MSITDQQRLIWERRIGTIGTAYTEKYVAEVLEELAKANPLHFECPWCECKWKFHTQAQLDMIQRHMNAHQNAAVQAAVGSLQRNGPGRNGEGMSDGLQITHAQMAAFQAALSNHDSRHNICSKCFHTVILIDGEWSHNRVGYVANHSAQPAGKMFAGCREIFAGDEIIVDPYLAPTLKRTPRLEKIIADNAKSTMIALRNIAATK